MGMQDYGPAQNPLNSPSHTAHHKAIADAIVVDGPLTDRFAPIEHYHEGSRGYLFTYSGTDTAVAPPAGGVALTQTGGQTRRLALSDTDANGVARNVSLLLPGDGIVITDDPAEPPITGFARYILTADPIPQAGYTVMDLLRIDTVGSQTPPPVGTRVRIVAAYASANSALGRYEDYTPVIGAGLTLGDGVASGRFARIGNLVHLMFSITLGATSQWPGATTINVGMPPGIVSASNGQRPENRIKIMDQGTNALSVAYASVPVSSSAVLLYPYALDTHANIAWSATAPIPWAAGDVISGDITFEAA